MVEAMSDIYFPEPQAQDFVDQTVSVVPGEGEWLLGVPPAQVKLLPEIKKDKNWNPYTKWGPTLTKKDIKVRAKQDWGVAVANHLIGIGFNV